MIKRITYIVLIVTIAISTCSCGIRDESLHILDITNIDCLNNIDEICSNELKLDVNSSELYVDNFEFHTNDNEISIIFLDVFTMDDLNVLYQLQITPDSIIKNINKENEVNADNRVSLKSLTQAIKEVNFNELIEIYGESSSYYFEYVESDIKNTYTSDMPLVICENRKMIWLEKEPIYTLPADGSFLLFYFSCEDGGINVCIDTERD